VFESKEDVSSYDASLGDIDLGALICDSSWGDGLDDDSREEKREDDDDDEEE